MISVCITTFNGERFIKDQLYSILQQLNAEDEIIISDDGSMDLTVKIIEDFKDERIKIFMHLRNKLCYYPFYRITKNVENALNHAKGDLIFLADQDDSWVSTKVQTVIQEMGNNLCLLHDCIVVNGKGEEIYSSYFYQNRSKLGIIENLINNSYLGCCMVIRKEFLNTVLPFPLIPIPHDIWIGLLAECKGGMKICDKKLLYYRRHSSNQSTSSEKSNADFLYKIRYRINIILALSFRLLLKK